MTVGALHNRLSAVLGVVELHKKERLYGQSYDMKVRCVQQQPLSHSPPCNMRGEGDRHTWLIAVAPPSAPIYCVIPIERIS